MSWRPSVLTTTAVAISLALVGNLATNTVSVHARWWPFAVWAATGLLAAAALTTEIIRVRTGAQGVRDTLILSDLLAEAAQRMWSAIAAERGLLAPAPIPMRWLPAHTTLSGSTKAATGTTGAAPAFPTLPGVAAATAQSLASGGDQADLHRLHGGLASGRLVIIGPAGAGKTAAGVLLLLEMVAHRRSVDAGQRHLVPVPVAFTLRGWDAHTRLEDWLAREMLGAFRFLRHEFGRAEAEALIGGGHVVAVLDGLDELPRTSQPHVLRALSLARIRIVLLTRTAEFARSARNHRLVDAAVVRLQPISAEVAADYLDRALSGPAPDGWAALLEQVRNRPRSPIARALSTPLGVTMLRDLAQTSASVTDLADAGRFANRTAVEQVLMSQLVTTAYTRLPGQPAPPYPLETAHRALTFIAVRMAADKTRDLRWWDVLRWAPRQFRIALTATSVAVVAGSAVTVGTSHIAGLTPALWTGSYVALGAAVICRNMCESPLIDEPQQLSGLRRHHLFQPVVLGGPLVFFLSLAPGLMLGGSAVSFATTKNPLDGAITGALVAMIGGSALGLVFALSQTLTQPDPTDVRTADPVMTWRNDRRFGLVAAVAAGLAGALVGLASGGPMMAVPGLVTGASLGAVLFRLSWPARLAFWQLRRHGLPVDLLGFLEDARLRGLLRTVGPVYQFRHAQLQDHLVAGSGGVQDEHGVGSHRNHHSSGTGHVNGRVGRS